MKNKYSRLFLFSALLLTAGLTAFASGEVEDYPTTFKIEVRDDGSAVWILAHRSKLDTAEEESFFRSYVTQFEELRTEYMENFSERMTVLVKRASIVTGRSMEPKNFDVSVAVVDTATGKFGVIKYQFEWVNFANLDRDRIIIGDVFEAGLFLFRDDALVIRYPVGYEVDTAFPAPNGTGSLS